MQYQNKNSIKTPAQEDKVGNKDMATIGTKKTLRNGITLKVTKINPVTTFNAIKRELIKRSYELDSYHKAATGSRYLEMHSGNIEIDVRCSNHTYASIPLSIGINRFDTENKIYQVSIDLSAINMNIAGFRSVMNEIDHINTHNLLAGIVSIFKAEGMDPAKAFLESKEISEMIIIAVCDYLKNFVK